MRYVEARVDKFIREETYRIYVTRSLQLAPQNKFMQRDYIEVLKSSNSHDDRNGDEIAVDIMTRAGLKFG